ncbi:uncharacterized protein LOC143253353 isoform X2 [Tachypleus tridentatus]|uniref:uncharacterized protein LOC143253353 isoform X2 n=1 Tax=Tachypleus tridentatus TaxID=6853 RepID=UPI003FD2CE25
MENMNYLTCFQECSANLTLKMCGCIYDDYPYLYEFPGSVHCVNSLWKKERICCKGFAYYSQQRGYDLPTPSKISGIRAVQLHWWISWNMAWYLTGKHIGYNH